MAMKKDNLGLFFLGKDEADNLFEAKQTGEKDGAAVDDKCDDEANHPIDIQLLDEESDQGNGGEENDDVKPITTLDFQFQDAFGEQVLQESRDRLHGKAGASRAYRLESWYDDEIQQNVDSHACCRHKVKLLEAAVRGE